jgi:hypothetical protein
MCIVAADDSGSTMLGPKSGSRVVSNSGERGSGRSSTTLTRGATARPSGTRLIKTALASSADATDIALQGQALFNLKDSRKVHLTSLIPLFFSQLVLINKHPLVLNSSLITYDKAPVRFKLCNHVSSRF